MAFATLADLKVTLQIADSQEPRDTWLQAALDAADDWVREIVRADYDFAGTATQKFYNVHEDAKLHIPVPGATVEEVRRLCDADSTAEVLEEDCDYVVEAPLENGLNQWIRLEPIFRRAVSGLDGEAFRTRLPRDWRVIEMDYSSDGSVPAPINRATTQLAGILFETGPQLSSGKISERIGDYSYSLTGGGERQLTGHAGGFGLVMRLLRPFIKAKVLVT